MSHHIKDALQSILKNSDDWKRDLLNNWPTIMGGLSDKVCLEKVRGETLFLGVYEASWMQELYLLSPTLIKTINSYLGKPYVKELRFKSAAKKKVTVKKEIVGQQQALPTRTLSPQEQEALAQVNDPQLRLMLQDYLGRCYREIS